MSIKINTFNVFSPCYLGLNDDLVPLHELQEKLPQYDLELINSLINISRGPEGGKMETLGLVTSIKNSEVYEIKDKTLKLSSQLFALNLEEEACNPSSVVAPGYLEFTAEWDQKIISSGEGNNILGDNGGLYFDASNIKIPKVAATKEALAYYGAVLISEGSAIRFPNDDAYPIWKMQVGHHYVRDYIMNKNEGGGFYLEYHHDQPHFHMVIEGGGYYLLAKQVNEKTFQITAFELSSGQAIYTKKGAIHCDAALTGELVVGYAASDDCSTVLLRHKSTNEMVNIEFV